MTAALAVLGPEVILVDRVFSRLWSRETLLFALVGGTVALVDQMPEAFARLVLEFLRS